MGAPDPLRAARGKPRRIPTGHQLLKAIRAYCVECVGNMPSEVEKCTAAKCRLFPYRMGRLGFEQPKRFDLQGGEGHDVGSGEWS